MSEPPEKNLKRGDPVGVVHCNKLPCLSVLRTKFSWEVYFDGIKNWDGMCCGAIPGKAWEDIATAPSILLCLFSNQLATFQRTTAKTDRY